MINTFSTTFPKGKTSRNIVQAPTYLSLVSNIFNSVSVETFTLITLYAYEAVFENIR